MGNSQIPSTPEDLVDLPGGLHDHSYIAWWSRHQFAERSSIGSFERSFTDRTVDGYKRTGYKPSTAKWVPSLHLSFRSCNSGSYRHSLGNRDRARASNLTLCRCSWCLQQILWSRCHFLLFDRTLQRWVARHVSHRIGHFGIMFFHVFVVNRLGTSQAQSKYDLLKATSTTLQLGVEDVFVETCGGFLRILFPNFGLTEGCPARPALFSIFAGMRPWHFAGPSSR